MEIKLEMEQSEEFLKWIDEELDEKKYLDQNHQPSYNQTIIDFPDIQTIITDIFTIQKYQALALLILTQRIYHDPELQSNKTISRLILELSDDQHELHNTFLKAVNTINTYSFHARPEDHEEEI